VIQWYPLMPVWIALPATLIVLVAIAWHARRVLASDHPPSRKRIRLANAALMMLLFPLLAAGLSLINPDARPGTWALVWTAIMALVAVSVTLAIVDALNTVRLLRRARAELASSLRAPVAQGAEQKGRRAPLRAVAGVHAVIASPQPPPVPMGLGRLVEPVYRAVVARRNRAFDAGTGVVRLSVPVVSIGNLSVGGTGKTPMVMSVCRWLRHAERRPIIAMRGYKKRDGEASDEQAEYEATITGVRVVAQPDRVAGLTPLLAEGAGDCVVLDDGFQHRRIARDADIVLIDATRSPFVDRCLPAGWLREPTEALRRATAVVLTHTEAATPAMLEELRRQVEVAHGKPPIAEARHAWDAIVQGATRHDPSWLAGKRVIVACGIGNPSAFVAMAHAAGAQIVGSDVRADHHAWSARDAAELEDMARRTNAEVVLVSQKDWVKLRAVAAAGGVPVAYPALTMRFDRGAEALRDHLLQRVGVAP
jgi:tetraacyldisaccharide 4'-kinase